MFCVVTLSCVLCFVCCFVFICFDSCFACLVLVYTLQFVCESMSPSVLFFV